MRICTKFLSTRVSSFVSDAFLIRFRCISDPFPIRLRGIVGSERRRDDCKIVKLRNFVEK